VTTAALSEPHATTPPSSRKLAVWLFLGSEIVFFSALILNYVVIRITSPNWPLHEQVSHVLNIPLTAVNTFILILSSVAVVLGLEAAQHGKPKVLFRWLLLTLVLGCTFLGVQAFEYSKLIGEGLTMTSVPKVMANSDVHFGSTFFTMTGFHGLHVLVGVLMLLIVMIKARKGHYTQQHHEGVELWGLYWHFVDAVWIVLFTLAYILY
jgi:cytochrome c oxidase subunit 3